VQEVVDEGFETLWPEIEAEIFFYLRMGLDPV